MKLGRVIAVERRVLLERTFSLLEAISPIKNLVRRKLYSTVNESLLVYINVKVFESREFLIEI